MDIVDPSRITDRKDNDEPKSDKSSTAKPDPMRAREKIDKDDPKRPMDRSDIDEPI
jgi:hypothetical protein